MAIAFRTISGDYGGDLQAAIDGSVATGKPVYGTPGSYTISSPVNFVEGAQLVFLPGATISWTPASAILCPFGSDGLPRSWRGGAFGPSGTPAGDLFVVNGDLVTIEDVTITGVRTGAAIRVAGNRCSIINPTISGGPGSIGVAVNGGTQFRMQDGTIPLKAMSCRYSTRPRRTR